MNQNEPLNETMIIGSGVVKVYKYFDSRFRISYGKFEKELMIGDT